MTGRFDGGRISSDAGGLLLREVDKRTGLTARVSRCLVDYRNPASVEHSVHELVSQRLHAIALGYEDLNDHGELRCDAVLSLLVGKSDMTGETRIRERDRGYALAGASKLNRMELGEPEEAAHDRYKRIVARWALRCTRHTRCIAAPASRRGGSATSPTGLESRGVAAVGWWARRSICRRERIRGSWPPISRRARAAAARRLYEKLYCACGEMENRIKEQQLDLFADRTSAHTMPANQMRLYFSSFAYVLMYALRRLGAEGTQFVRAQCVMLRQNLLKIGARVKVTARRIWLSFSQAYPYAETFTQVLANLQKAPLRNPSG